MNGGAQAYQTCPAPNALKYGQEVPSHSLLNPAHPGSEGEIALKAAESARAAASAVLEAARAVEVRLLGDRPSDPSCGDAAACQPSALFPLLGGVASDTERILRLAHHALERVLESLPSPDNR